MSAIIEVSLSGPNGGPLTRYVLQGLETLRQSAISVPSNYDALFRNVAEDAYNFLQNHQWFDEPIENDFQAMFATAALLLRNTLQDPLLLPRLIDPTSEVHNYIKNISFLTND